MKTRVFSTVIKFAMFALFGAGLTGCYYIYPRRVAPGGAYYRPSTPKVKYRYEHIVEPDSNYNGLGGGSLDLPGAQADEPAPEVSADYPDAAPNQEYVPGVSPATAVPETKQETAPAP